MLNEYQIKFLPERIAGRINAINNEYLEETGRVLKKIGELRPKDVHQLQQMYNYGADMDRVINKLEQVSGKNVQEIYDIFDIVAKENYDYSKPFYEAQGMKFIPYGENEDLQGYVKSLAKQTAGEYINLTQHTAFAVFDKGGKSIAPLYMANKDKVATSLSDTYTKLVDYAVTKVQLGEESYQKAIKDVCKAMVNSGIKTVDYATGYSRNLESAVRQNVLWGVKECNQNTADRIGEEFGADGYEVSYHSNPRETHADMAGKQFAKGPARYVKGVYYPSFEEEAEPLLKEPNCLHFKFSILLGISAPAYSKAQLAAFKAEDNKTFEFEGKTYTKYEASQVQNALERKMVTQKELANMAKAAGDDDLRREAQGNINLLTSKYHGLCQASGLPTRAERMNVNGFRKVKTIDKSAENGIMKVNNVAEVQNLQYIGKIDTEIYQKAASTKIITDEVIITNNQIKHIIDRRGQDFFDEYSEYFSKIVSNPDFIFKDKAENTAIATKTFVDKNNTSVNLVVRLAVEGDNEDYKNSIITAIKESDKRFKQRLRNNQPIYRRVDNNE
ncbi:MAG: hypothetical protein IKT39_02480 [Clostridia bacterium]|nr:hypothetical protein [Clostridia bacterium]